MDGSDNQMGDKPKGNVFDLYGPKRRERQPDGGGPGTEERGYYACGLSIVEGIKGTEEWFRIHDAIEGQYTSMDMLRYADVVRVYCPVPEMLCLMCEHVIYKLEGRNLDVIPIHIQDRVLRALYLFDPNRYPEPGADETVILHMECEDIGRAS